MDEPSWYTATGAMCCSLSPIPDFAPTNGNQPDGQDSKVAPVADTRRWLCSKWTHLGMAGESLSSQAREKFEGRGEEESAWQHTTSESEFRDRPIAQGDRWTAGCAQGAR